MTVLEKNGFTLVEVLISVLVLAIGVIGIAGMQLTALRTAQQSAFQTAALQLASEMADKMRANYQQMQLPDKSNLFLNVDYQSADDVVVTPPKKICYRADCSAEELAKFDIYEWMARIKSALPGGRVRICRDSRPWDKAAGAFSWTCPPPAAGVNNTPVVIKIGWHGKGRNPDGSVIDDPQKIIPPGVALTVEPYTK